MGGSFNNSGLFTCVVLTLLLSGIIRAETPVTGPPEFELAHSGGTQPRSFAAVNEGGSVRFHAMPPTNHGAFAAADWRWYFQSNAIFAATNTYLVISNASMAEAGTYTLVASNSYAPIARSITLIVEPVVRTVFSTRRPTWEEAQSHHELDARAPYVAANSASQLYLLGTQPARAGWFLTKFTQSGSILWSRNFGPVATPAGIAVDAAQNVIVACTTNYYADGGPVLVKYDPNGELLWRKQVIVGSNPWRFTTDFAQNDAGEVFVAGSDTGANPPGIFLAKVAATGTQSWARVVPVNSASWTFTRASLAPTPGGGVYLASIFGMARFSASGQKRWEHEGNFVAVAIAPDGDVYATGDNVISKITPLGELRWTAQLDGVAIANRLKADAYGAVVLHNNGVARYGPEGSNLWSSARIRLGALGLDASGRAHYSSLAGSFITHARDLQGREVWRAASDVTRSAFNEDAADLVVCPNGDVAVAYRNEDYYIVERYRPGETATASPLNVAISATGPMTPGTRVCLSASGLDAQVRYVWFRNGTELPGQTNQSLCFTADLNTEGWYNVAAIAPERVLTYDDIECVLRRPYLYQPIAIGTDQIQLRLLPLTGNRFYRIDTSPELQTWTARAGLLTRGDPVSITLPMDVQPALFYRAVSQ